MHLSALYLYPVKGMRGIRVDQAELDALGLRHDRRWMLVDPQNRFLSQRTVPRLVLVRGELDAARLRLTAPDADPLELELEPEPGPEHEVQLWSRRVRGTLCPERQSRWFSRALGTECRLLRLAAPGPAGYGPAETPPAPFSDGFPLHLLSLASLDDLNRRLPEPLSVERFRPNLVIAGAAPYAEDHWVRFRAGPVPMRTLEPCTRCAVTTVDPATARRGKEPLRTLAGYRAGGEGVRFGTYVAHQSAGRLRVGDLLSHV